MCEGKEVKEQVKDGLPDALKALLHALGAVWAIGPALLWEANLLVLRALPRGFVRSQTLATVFLVDRKKVHEVSLITAALVKLGLTWLVRDIVVCAVEELDRPDAIAENTAELMSMYEFSVVTQINNSMVEAGAAMTGARVTGALGQKVSQDTFEAMRESTANFLSGLWPGFDKQEGGKEAASGFARGENLDKGKEGEKRKVEEEEGPSAQRKIEGEDMRNFLGELTKAQAQGSKKDT